MALDSPYAPQNNFGQIQMATNPNQKKQTGIEQPNDLKPNSVSGGNNYQTNNGQPSYAGPSSDGTAISAASNSQQPAAQGTYMPQGYDPNKWADPNKHDAKYDIGRILSKYPPTPEGLQQANAELQAAGLGSVTGKDKITLAQGHPEYGGHTIDVGQNFTSGQNTNWYWNDLNAPGGAMAGGPSNMAGSGIGTTGPAYMGSQEQNMKMRPQKRNTATTLASSAFNYGPQNSQMDVSQFLGPSAISNMRTL